MQNIPFEQKALFEHLFWLQILGDHARFLFNDLSPKETSEVETARSFIMIFDALLAEARNTGNISQLNALTQEAFGQANALRDFKLHLLKRQLLDKIALHDPPTFLNHMLNELEEYLRILQYMRCGEIPPLVHPIHHDLLWLPDAAGHAAAIAAGLDETEQALFQKSRDFIKQFHDLYLKAIEIKGYLRTCVLEFPALDRFHTEIRDRIAAFMDFLCYMKDYIMKNEVLTTLPELIPDHMLREECYFLTKLAEETTLTIPTCDPTWPRPAD